MLKRQTPCTGLREKYIVWSDRKSREERDGRRKGRSRSREKERTEGEGRVGSLL